jgi:hypothetical protein
MRLVLPSKQSVVRWLGVLCLLLIIPTTLMGAIKTLLESAGPDERLRAIAIVLMVTPMALPYSLMAKHFSSPNAGRRVTAHVVSFATGLATLGGLVAFFASFFIY